MSGTVLRGKGQITIPSEIRRAAQLEEGDVIEVELVADGILLKPRKTIDSTQAWFWTPRWQALEREADADRDAGRSETFKTGDALLDALRRRR